MNTYLCDIDGTLADNSHRNPFDETKVLLDKPLPTIQVIKSLIQSKNTIIYLSGRTDNCRVDTETWLFQYIGEKPILFMRKSGDNRSDDIIKKEIYDQKIKPYWNISGVFDDRLKVCRMWYDLGLFVFNCNQGLKEF